VFFLGVFWKRLNAKGCMAAMLTGFAMGLFRLAVDTPVKLMSGFNYTEGTFLWVVNNIFFQYYSLLIFLVCVVVMIAVSYASKEPSYEKLSGLTFSTTTEEQRAETRSSWSAGDVIGSVVLILIIIGIYVYFSG